MKQISIYTDGYGTIKKQKLSYIVKHENDDILIRPIYVGVCGTDKKIVNLQYKGIDYPRILGHEWVGIVVESASERIPEGKFVTGECSLYCKKCRLCILDYNSCVNLKKFGITCDGAMRSVFWFYSEFAHIVPSLEYVWCFVEPMASALHLLYQLKINRNVDYRVLIVGAGQMGILSAVALLEDYDNMKVSIRDINKEKEERAFSLLKDLVPFSQKEKYDIIIDTVGNSESIKYCCEKIEKSGQVCTFGTTGGEIRVSDITLNCLSIYGTIGGSGFFKKAIDLIEKHLEKIRKIETVTIEMSKTDAIDFSSNKKIIIDMR